MEAGHIKVVLPGWPAFTFWASNALINFLCDQAPDRTLVAATFGVNMAMFQLFC